MGCGVGRAGCAAGRARTGGCVGRGAACARLGGPTSTGHTGAGRQPPPMPTDALSDTPKQHVAGTESSLPSLVIVPENLWRPSLFV